MNQELIGAFLLAEYAHRALPLKPENAYRKYDKADVPYIIHPVSLLFRYMDRPSYTVTRGKVCLLHDVLEDTSLEHYKLIEEVGREVYAGVVWLTSYSKQTKSSSSRSSRKQMDRAYLAGAPVEYQEIKLLDRLDNMYDMAGAGAGFLSLYVEETRLLVKEIGGAAPDVSQQLLVRCQELEA